MCQIGIVRGLRCLSRGGGVYERLTIPVKCKTWGCPECGPAKARQLLRRALQGAIAENKTGSTYGVKLFTLTLPGRRWRAKTENPRTSEYTGKIDPEMAYKIMMKNFNRLLVSIRRNYGGCHYFRVSEAHRDGFPHIHFLINGEAVISRDILPYIRRLWTDKYGMGNVDVKAIDGDVKEAVRYAVKYLLKDASKGKFYRTSRPVSWSRGALAANVKLASDWEGVSYEPGGEPVEFTAEIMHLNRHEVETELWNINALVGPYAIKAPYQTRAEQERYRQLTKQADRILAELGDWFAKQGAAEKQPKQMGVFDDYHSRRCFSRDYESG